MLEFNFAPDQQCHASIGLPAHEVGQLLVSLQRLFFRLQMWLNAKDGQLQALSGREKNQCRFELLGIKPLEKTLQVHMPNASIVNEKAVDLFQQILARYLNQAVFEPSAYTPSRELISTCHADLIALAKNGLRCAASLDGFRLSVSGQPDAFQIGPNFIRYSKAISGRRYPGDRLQISIAADLLEIEKGRICAKLRPGLKWVLRLDADKFEQFRLLLEGCKRQEIRLIGRPELYFGLASKKTSIFDVEYFSLADTAT